LGLGDVTCTLFFTHMLLFILTPAFQIEGRMTLDLVFQMQT